MFVYINHASLISKVSSLLTDNSSLICMGDFNLPGVSWISGENIVDYVPSSYPIGFDAFWDIIFESCLYEVNDILNIKDRLLDLVFSSSLNISISRVSPFVLPEDSYHPTLLINLELKTSSPKFLSTNALIKRRNFGKTNLIELRTLLSNTIWRISDDIDSSVSTSNCYI